MTTFDPVTEASSKSPLEPNSLPEHIRDVFSKATCLHSKAEIDSALDHMATAISYRLAHTNPVFLCVVVGGIVALGNLLPRLDFPLEVDYVHATRYNNSTRGSELVWKSYPDVDLTNRTVVIVDDILDGGITLNEILKYCQENGAKEVYSAVLVDKASARLPSGLPTADFCGLTVENHYVFGFGMDYKGYLRNAPGIYVVAPEHE